MCVCVGCFATPMAVGFVVYWFQSFTWPVCLYEFLGFKVLYGMINNVLCAHIFTLRVWTCVCVWVCAYSLMCWLLTGSNCSHAFTQMSWSCQVTITHGLEEEFVVAPCFHQCALLQPLAAPCDRFFPQKGKHTGCGSTFKMDTVDVLAMFASDLFWSTIWFS